MNDRMMMDIQCGMVMDIHTGEIPLLHTGERPSHYHQYQDLVHWLVDLMDIWMDW